MGWKNIKETFCPDMDVYMDRKDIRIYFNGYEIIRINTESLEIATSNTLKTSKIVTSLEWKLENAKKTGNLKKLLDKPDTFENNLSVFTIKGNRIVEEFCEKYGCGNPTHSGERMSNTYFLDWKDARKYLKKKTSENLKDAFHYSFIASFKNVIKGTVKLIKVAWVWLKVRV